MKIFKIREDVFKVEPLFVTDCSFEEMRTYLHKRFKVNPSEGRETFAGTVLTFDVSPWRVVWIRNSKHLHVISHELFHLVTSICQARGVPIVAHHPTGENGDETAAYMFEFYFSETLKRLKARKA